MTTSRPTRSSRRSSSPRFDRDRLGRHLTPGGRQRPHAHAATTAQVRRFMAGSPRGPRRCRHGQTDGLEGLGAGDEHAGFRFQADPPKIVRWVGLERRQPRPKADMIALLRPGKVEELESLEIDQGEPIGPSIPPLGEIGGSPRGKDHVFEHVPGGWSRFRHSLIIESITIARPL